MLFHYLQKGLVLSFYLSPWVFQRVMIYVSFVEILVKAKDALTSALGVEGGSWAAVGGFFFGILIIAIIDKLIPSTENLAGKIRLDL